MSAAASAVKALAGACHPADLSRKLDEVIGLANNMLAIGQANNTGARLAALEAQTGTSPDLEGLKGRLAQLESLFAALPSQAAIQVMVADGVKAALAVRPPA